VTSLQFEPERGLQLTARHGQAATDQPRTAVLLNLDGGEAARTSPLAAELRQRGCNLVTLDLRATGELAHPKNTIGRAPDHNSAQWAIWMGRPLLGQWVYDVRRLLDVIQQAQKEGFKPVTLIGQGPAGLVALCAAAVDREQHITQVAAVGTLASYISDVPYEGQRVGVLAPGIVRDVGDVPHLAALALPRRVVIAGGVNGGGEVLGEEELSRAYEITHRLAAIAGQTEALVIRESSDSISLVLE
jgi:hypothetical protein